MSDTVFSEERMVLEKQKLLADRIYTKIDYLKNNRLRIPAFVALANFAILTVMVGKETPWLLDGIVILSFIVIGWIARRSLETLRLSFRKNIQHLEYLYGKMKMKDARYMEMPDTDLAEMADEIWDLLHKIIFLSCAVPSIVILLFDVN